MTRFLISCPKPAAPSGGVWMLFKMAEVLRQIGHEATVVLTEPFTPDWFAYEPAQGLSTDQPMVAGDGNVVIVPETSWPQPPRIYMLPGVRKICFIQNFVWLNRSEYLREPGETLVCSRFLWNYAKRELNANVIGKFTPFLEEGVWSVTDKTPNRVLVFGRRNDYHQKLVPILEANGYTVDYVTTPLTQREIAERLGTCEFYVHLVHPEGFPMACLEAMRSGTLVVGTTGGGGNEFLHQDFTAWVVQDPENGHYGDGDHFIELILEGLNILRADPERRSRIWTQALDWSLRYNLEAAKAELKGIFP